MVARTVTRLPTKSNGKSYILYIIRIRENARVVKIVRIFIIVKREREREKGSR